MEQVKGKLKTETHDGYIGLWLDDEFVASNVSKDIAARLVQCWNDRNELLEGCATALGICYTLSQLAKQKTRPLATIESEGWIKESLAYFTDLIAKAEQS